MSTITLNPNKTGAEKSTTSGRLFFLDVGGGRVFRKRRERINEQRLYPLAFHDFRYDIPDSHGRLLSFRTCLPRFFRKFKL